MDAPIVLPLDTDRATLENAGGKALNLARLLGAGFPVPPGFIVTTAAYESFVQANGLSAAVLEIVEATAPDDLPALEAASRAVRARFAAGHMPAALAEALHVAYAALNGSPVAVRSSATAEDLPGLSFAGQQDTYLNVVGDGALQKAVIDCWSSLWTARAIGYRARNGISHRDISLAVVVQKMVPAETSGVLFTANPLTGKRSEIVIDATLGLGEALVSGQVEPDHYIVGADGRISSKTLGAKAIAIHGQASGGTVTVRQEIAGRQALSDAQILDLAHLGRRAADLFGEPQDVEWAGVDGRFYLLQSRPVTTLYPVPEGLGSAPLQVFLSFGAVQGLLDPVTPLGRDMLRGAFAGAARVFGHVSTLEDQPTMREAGERLWMNITGMVDNHLGRKVTMAALEYIEPAARQALEALVRSGEWPAPGRPRLRTFLRLLRVLVPAAFRAVCTLLHPDVERERTLRNLESWFVDWQSQMETTSGLGEHAALARRTVDDTFTFVLPHFVPRFGMGMATYNLLTRLAAALPGDQPGGSIDTRTMMRGVAHNVTTEMDLTLWRTAQSIRADPVSLAHCTQVEAWTLAVEYKAGRLHPVAQASVRQFMDRYGMRGPGEIDLGHPRWREDPTPLMQALQSYLHIDDPELAPDAVFERGKQRGEAEVERLVAALGRTRGGWVKARLARAAARRMRALIGLRETPKFYIVRLLGVIRETLLADGQALVDAGLLERPDDMLFLHLAELDALAAGRLQGVLALVRARRQEYAREQRRRQVPRLLLSDGRAFYEGISGTAQEQGATLAGSPVSPGLAEGTVRVVLDPRGAQLLPGEILVCPGTDPAWTPLFLAAGGLVMEVGGMMTHGAVVAREYGIPAVVGVHEATQRLRTGQRVRVDGSSGQVTVLEA